MAIIVEDGSGVANANSYVSLVDARTYAALVGLTLPADDTEAEQALLGAMPYIEAQPWQGQPADPAQALSWPRILVLVNGVEVASNIVPAGVWKAQVTAAAMVAAGTDLLPTIAGGQVVTKEKVGPIETEYSDQYWATADGKSIFSAIDALIGQYLNLFGGYRLSPQFGF